MTSPYTKTHEVMLDKEVKKLKKEIKELQEHVERLNKFMCETIHDAITKVKQDATINR